jgi:L-fucose isomerase-like protein
MKLGVAAISRPTFDVPHASEMADAAVAQLGATDHDLVGDAALLMDEDAVAARAAEWDDVDGVVVIQATFADSTLVMAIAATGLPLYLWGIPEPRTGGRLRLNSLCGINLAAFALRSAGYNDPAAPRRTFTYTYQEPGGDPWPFPPGWALPPAPQPPPSISDGHRAAAREAVAKLRRARVGIIGDHPEGFEPCAYTAAALAAIGPVADRVELTDLFEAADSASSEDVATLRRRAERSIGPLDDLDQTALDKSLRIGSGLRRLAEGRQWSAVATRCWPECFTEYGGAVCSPHAMMSEDGIPGLCEADAYGGVTALLLQSLTGGPTFVADLVELSGDTGVFWHCGNAPTTMAGTSPVATVHSNRRKPLLGEFVLRPGIMTVCRLSQSANRHRLVVGTVEAVDAPLPFSGTSAVVRFERPVLPTIMSEGLEHHYGLSYGDVTPELYAVADDLGLDVVRL